MRSVWSLLFAIVSLAVAASGQVGGGGAAAGLGKVFEASGRSAAARGLQSKLGSALQRAVNRPASSGGRRTPPSRSGSTARSSVQAAPSSPSYSTTPAITSTFFTPDPRTSNMDALADSIGSNEAERQQLRQLFAATKQVFEQEVAKKGRSNNIAAAFTFFIASTVTVYHDDPEPSDAAIDQLWDGFGTALAELPEMSRMTNAEKQQIYDMLVAFSGFVLAGYMEGKKTDDAEVKKVFKQLSGVLIQTVLKTDPAKLRFTPSGLNIS